MKTTMKSMTAVVFGACVFACGAGMAAAPQLSASKTLEIDAPAAKVWKQVRDFNGLGSWHPAVASDEIVEGKNNTVGAVRLLTLKGGGTIKEKLLAFNPAARTFKYSILEGVLPVSDYTSTFVVKPLSKGKSSVTWTGHFKRKNPADNPADTENDKTAVDAINGVYQGGLDNLKKLLETP
jgi:mxaD protein